LDEEDWFSDANIRPNIEAAIVQFLPETKSWSQSLRIWGQEGGHRIDVHYDEARVSSIFVRVSAQDDPGALLPRLIDLCRQFDLVMVTEDFDVLPAELKRLKQACVASSAFSFVKATAEQGGFPRKW
jgi:hypothetical protein